MILNKLKYTFSGWTGALILLIIYLASEFGTVALGGDFGGFLYVTMHFIVNPLLGVLVIVLTMMKMPKFTKPLDVIYQGIPVVIPALIIYIAISVNVFEI